MKFLIGVDSSNKEGKKLLLNELQAGVNDTSEDILVVHDWISTLSYVAIENYSAIWMDWSLLKRNYFNFHRKLYKLRKQIPLIIFTSDSKIDCKISISMELLFSIVWHKEIPKKVGNLLKQLQLFENLMASMPKKTKHHLRPNGLGPFIGNSIDMLEIYKQIIKVAQTDFTVLIFGESGSGKELVARTIHELSSRKDHRFISLNCAAIPENLLESELFGFEKGAFTGADKSKPGKFELADKGSLFLDEIGDMPVTIQAKLLRVLEDHTIERLGSTTSKKIDVRLISATNQNLQELISERKFRSDLHYRLNVIPINLSPLRNKSEDILLLTLHVLGKLTGKDRKSARFIDWTLIEELKQLELFGNVRELENLLTRILFNSDASVLNKKMLRGVIQSSDVIHKKKGSSGFSSQGPSDEGPLREDGIAPLWYTEKMAIRNALKIVEGNISKAANSLEISRTALYRKIKKYELDNQSDS
ncbi:MAG: sigma-54-dependent Fis family transcriptional regulator [Candidatus Marinimicrobia bacterium]|nr:sigma-54-dependent Fis family transcriptional regulator [Candidatus Neomarinimicrobiota bacterium]